MKRNPTKSYITNSLLYLLYLHPSNVEQNSFRSRRNQSVFTSRPCLQSKQTSSYHSWLIVHWWRYSFTLGTRSTRFFIRITNSLYQWIRTRGARLSLSLFFCRCCIRKTATPEGHATRKMKLFQFFGWEMAATRIGRGLLVVLRKGWSYARNIKVLGDGNGICIQCNDGTGVWKGEVYIYI